MDKRQRRARFWYGLAAFYGLLTGALAALVLPWVVALLAAVVVSVLVLLLGGLCCSSQDCAGG